MSQSRETTHPDPLIDAYRQASDREGVRAGANVRAAVLAHARVVTQSSGTAVGANGLTDVTRATAAANESRPIWRLAAGVVIGLVGVWIFQLTRPSPAPDTAVAVATAPSVSATSQADKARAAEPAVAAAPASPPAAAAPEATGAVAVTAPPVAKDSLAKPTSAARERQPDTAPREQNLAMAKVVAPKEKTDRPSVFTGTSAPAAAASAADASANSGSDEVVIASAEMRKSAKAESRAAPSSPALAMPASPAAAAPPAAAPNAFPAQIPEVAIAATPAPRPAPAAAAAAPWRVGGSGAVAARGEAGPAESAAGAARPPMSIQMSDAARVAPLGESDVAMFRAVRAGDIAALRVAISRGANVNGKDERGRTTLQIARERADVETIRVLETAGAR